MALSCRRSGFEMNLGLSSTTLLDSARIESGRFGTLNQLVSGSSPDRGTSYNQRVTTNSRKIGGATCRVDVGSILSFGVKTRDAGVDRMWGFW